MGSAPTPLAFPPTRSGEGNLLGGGRADLGHAAASATSMKWAALHDAADVVATLAGLEEEPLLSEILNFPAMIRDATPWRREAAETGIDDLAAIMEPGIAALLAVNARGADAQAPALALWREFYRARAALLAVAPPPGALDPRRAP